MSDSSDSSVATDAERRAAGQPRDQLLLADRADPARHALAAGLVAEELGDPAQQGGHGHRVVKNEHDAGAEGRPRCAHSLEGQRHVERAGADEHAGRAAEQHRLERPAAGHRRPRREITSRSVTPKSYS